MRKEYVCNEFTCSICSCNTVYDYRTKIKELEKNTFHHDWCFFLTKYNNIEQR